MHVVPRAVQSSQSSISAKFTVAHRLLRGDGFGHVIRAESVADEYFKIYFSRNGGNNARLGIIASKKMLPGAVERNRVKRAIREVFRRHSIKICKVDVVVMARRTRTPKGGARGGNLETLFSRVENKCAES